MMPFRKVQIILLHTICAVGLVACEATSEYLPFGLQTGNSPDSQFSSYASSMVFDRITQEVTITGGTYDTYFKPGEEPNDVLMKPDCFVAVLHLRDPTKISWLRRRQFGDPSVSEFCSDLHVTDTGRKVVIGHSGENGILSHLMPYGDTRRTNYGMVLDLNGGVDLDGGALLHSSEVQYPVAITGDPSGSDIYVAEIFAESDQSAYLADYVGDSRGSGADLTSTAYSPPPDGLKFSVRLQRLKSDTQGGHQSGVGETLFGGWSREYGVPGNESVQIAALEHLSSSSILLAGYTRGTGGLFGTPTDFSQGTIDGFLALIDPNTGNTTKSTRIESLLPGDDRIQGICRQDGAMSSDVYIVGTTDGFFDLTTVQQGSDQSREKPAYAFLLKYDLDEMEIIWSRQLGGVLGETRADVPAHVHGVSCAVTPDGTEVYMAGNVKNGASLSLEGADVLKSSGLDDIFVAKFQTNDGTLAFAKQTGSPQNDYIAPMHGLATDAGGNAVLVGSTHGSLFREKTVDGIADVFTMSISRDGRIAATGIPKKVNNDDHDSSGGGGDLLVRKVDEDSVRQARLQNALAAIGTLLALAFVFTGIFLVLRYRKGNSMDKASAVEKASESTSRWGSDTSIGAFDFVDEPNKNSAALARSALKSTDQSPRAKFDERLGIARRPSSRDSGSLSSISWSTLNTPFNEPGESSPRSSRIGVIDRSGEQRSNESPTREPSAYQEIYDLLSVASDRLSLGTEDEGPSLDERYNLSGNV